MLGLRVVGLGGSLSRTRLTLTLTMPVYPRPCPAAPQNLKIEKFRILPVF